MAGIGIENPNFPGIGICIGFGIDKLILQVLVFALVLTSKGIHPQTCSRYPKGTYKPYLEVSNYPKSAYIILLCPYMENSKRFLKCYVAKYTLSIGIGIEVLEFWACIGIGIGIDLFHI